MSEKNDLQLYNEIAKEVENIIVFDEFKNAEEFVGKINDLVAKKGYKENRKNLYSDYQKLIIKLKWVSLPLLNKKEIIMLFNDHFQAIFEMNYFDLKEKFKNVLLGIIIHTDRDVYKSDIKHVLEKNQALITSKKLANNLAPTVENWIKSYTRELGTGMVETLKLDQYFLQNQDFRNLSNEEKEKIKSFFEFYEKLKRSSLTAAGIEETIPVNVEEFKGQIRDGRLEKESTRLDPRLKNLSELVNQILESAENEARYGEYKEGSIEKKALEEEVSREKEIEDLQYMANKYIEGSLERRAIEEEIEKMNKE